MILNPYILENRWLRGGGITHMTMMTLKCPKCGAEAKLSLADNDYSGPRRCWKCHEFFTISIHNGRVTSCEPLSKEEYERQQEAKKAAEKSRGGINFSSQGQLDFTQNPPEKSRNGIDSSKQEEPDIFQSLAGKSRGGIDFVKRDEPAVPQKPAEKPQSGMEFSTREKPTMPQNPPVKRQEFIRPPMPKETSSHTESVKPGFVFPPDRIQTFVPLEDIKEEPEKPKKPKNPPEKRLDYTKPLSHKEPSSQTEPEKPGAIYPPDRIQTFVPLEDTKEE